MLCVTLHTLIGDRGVLWASSQSACSWRLPWVEWAAASVLGARRWAPRPRSPASAVAVSCLPCGHKTCPSQSAFELLSVVGTQQPSRSGLVFLTSLYRAVNRGSESGAQPWLPLISASSPGVLGLAPSLWLLVVGSGRGWGVVVAVSASARFSALGPALWDFLSCEEVLTRVFFASEHS